MAKTSASSVIVPSPGSANDESASVATMRARMGTSQDFLPILTDQYRSTSGAHNALNIQGSARAEMNPIPDRETPEDLRYTGSAAA